MGNRTEPAEPNRIKPLNSRTGRNQTRRRTKLDRATTRPKNANRTTSNGNFFSEPNRNEPNQTEQFSKNVGNVGFARPPLRRFCMRMGTQVGGRSTLPLSLAGLDPDPRPGCCLSLSCCLTRGLMMRANACTDISKDVVRSGSSRGLES